MSRVHRHPSLIRQATRVADDQLALALADLHRAGTARGDAVHDARRRIRTVRALLRMLRPRLIETTYLEANRRLRALSQRLAPVANARTVRGTLARLASRADAREARPAIDAVRTALQRRAERAAASTRMLKGAETTLAVERARIGTWEIEIQKLPIAGRLARSRRQATAAMTRAVERPSASRERAWRRTTTKLWLYVRLLEPYRPDLRSLREKLDALDTCLDESHNVTVLERILMAEALASRNDTATALRMLRHYHHDLRARAMKYGNAALHPQRRGHARATSPLRRTM